MSKLNLPKLAKLFFHLTAEILPDTRIRKRKQTPQTVLCTLLLLAIERSTTSTRRALTQLAGMFPKKGRRRQPTPAAFCQTRKKEAYDESHLREVFSELEKKADAYSPPSGYRIHGLNLIAMDGSQVLTPRSPSTIAEFGLYGSRVPSHQPHTRLMTAWDVYERKPINWVTGTCYESERAAAEAMIPSLPSNSLVLVDRGFHGIDAIDSFMQAKIQCLMRVRGGKTTWPSVQKFIKGNKKDDVVTLSRADEKSVTCRIIKFTKYNKRKKENQVYTFITSLMDKKKWTRKLLLRLYRDRWDIETSFREMKILDTMENFHTKSADGVRQEIASYMIARLLAGLIMRCVMKKSHPQTRGTDDHRILCNHKTITEAITDTIIAYANYGEDEACIVLRERIIVIEDAMQKRRPDRDYEIKCKGRYGRWKGTKNHRNASKEKSK